MVNWCNFQSLPGEEDSVDVSLKTNSTRGYGLSAFAQISADDKVVDPVRIKTRICDEWLSAAIDRTFVLVDLILGELRFSTSFSADIDVFCTLKKDSLSVIALRDGTVRVCSVENQCEVCEWKIPCPGECPIFVGLHVESDSSIILIDANGNIFRISFSVSKVDGLTEINNYECQTLFNCNSKIYSSCILENSYDSPSIILGSDGIFYHKDEKYIIQSTLFSGLVTYATKICTNKSETLVICLSHGKLYFYCSCTMMCLKVFDVAEVQDFILVEEEDGEDFVFASLLDGSGQHMLWLFSVFDFSCRIKLKVIHPSIVDTTSMSDALIFLDHKTLDGTENYLDEILLYKISESNPTIRLDNLLKKKLFGEAEKFAIEFKLDFQVIHKAQCLDLIDKMQSSGDYSQVKLLSAMLDKVEDSDFMVNLIQISKVVDLSALKTLLLYCLDRLQADDKEAARFGKLMDDVNLRLNLLDTYTMLWHSSGDESWTNFSARKLIDSFCQTVIKGEWMQAWILWERHWQQCVKEIDYIGQVVSILNKFPPGEFSPDVISVIEVFAKGITSHIPEAIDEISNWVVQKIRSMERMKNWPKAALDFSKRMLLLLSNSTYDDQSIILTKKFSSGELKLRSSSLLFLQSTVESLKDINYIYTEFDVKVKLSEYEQEQKQSLAILLLKKVSVEKYDEISSHYLMTYLNQHHLSLDDVISEIVEEVHDMTNHPSAFGIEETVPMEKLIALTERMKDAEKKGKCILLLMKTYPLPWNMKLSTLINCGLLLDHPISEKIKLQLNYTNALSILKKYHLEKLDIIRDFHRIIKYIVQSDKDEMVEDCQTIAITESKKEEVYTEAIKHCFMKREYEKAFKILEPLPKKTVRRILSAIVHKIHALMLLQNNNEEEYLDILKMIQLYVEEMYEKEVKFFFRETSLKDLTGIHFVKKYHKLEMTLEDAYIKSPVMQKILKQLEENLDGSACKIEPFLQVQQLSDVFRWSIDEILLQLLRSNCNVKALLELISKLIESTLKDSLVDILWWALSSLLGKSVSDDLVLILKSISYRGLQSCKSDDLSTHVEISRFLKIWLGSWDIKMQNSPASRAKHYPPFSYAILYARHPQWIRLNAPQELLPRIVALDSTRQMWHEMLLKDDCSSIFSFEAGKQCNEINKDAKEIHDESNLWLKFQVDCMITWNSALLQESSEMGKLEYIITLLRRVETSKEYDPIFMIGLLFCFEVPLAWTKDSISRSNANYRCMLFNSTIAMALGQMLNITESMKQYEDIYFSCLVYKRLTVLGINLRESEYFKMPMDILMKKIVGHNKITEENIEELCNMLGFDVKSAFMNYLMSKLLHWAPQYQIKTSLNAQEECVVTNSTDHILRIYWFIRPIFKEEEILAFVKDIWSKINLYYYELYEVLLEILTVHNADMKFITKQKDLIRFLRKYHRHSSPSATEIELSGNMGTMPEISRWRLPLLTSSRSTERSLTALISPSSFAGNIISAEVTFLNYPVWVAAPQIDDFDANRLCLLAIKNEMDVHFKDYRHRRDWHPYPSEEVFLQNVNTCIMKVENMKMATALIKYIMGKLPQGVDQLVAAEMCVRTAQKWVDIEENDEEAKEQLERIQWQYKCLLVMHILHQNGLGIDKYLNMINNPNDVISELYQDVPNLMASVIDRAGYGVNWAATKIASIFSINIVKFKLNLIATWISSRKEEMSEFCESFIGGELFANERQLYSLANDDDMRRLTYICKSMDKNIVMNHLVSIAFMYDEVNESLSTVAKLRVMLCMAEIDYEVAAEQAALRGISNLGSYIMKLFLLIPLEKVGVVHSISEFDSMDMQSIVKNLLQRNWQSNVSLAAKFCLVTSVFNHSIWENILKIMINSSMCQLLVEILPLLRHHSFFMGIKAYRNAWKVAVEGTFTKANNPMTSEEQKLCLACLKVIHLCPFMGDLDWQGIANACIKRSKGEMAALLLPFLPTKDSQELKNQILNHTSAKDVITKIQLLSEELPICTSQAVRILQGL